MITGKRILLSLALLFNAYASIAQKSPSSESDLKKQAEKLFEKESYQEAAPMYSQLLSLYPRESVYNYRYGVCLIMSGQDKTGAASYLQAAAQSKETDPDVHFYLGRSYMFMDRYNEALGEFAQFKKLGPSGKQIKLGVDRFIENCNNANILRTDRKNVVVLGKSKVNRAAFFAAYDFTDAAGKLLTTPDRFLTPIDKEKMRNPVMFMTRDGETIYFASDGKKVDNGKDLYRIIKLSDGNWSEPANLGGIVNTNADEDFAYLDKDGRTLYFSSTGHNSIGGYDVFKTQYDFNSGRWSAPVNVGMPINTVDDDLFFMPSTKGETASYSTAIETETGKIEYRNLGLGNAVSNLAVISGQYISEDQVTRRDARISVIRTKDNGVVTSVKTDRTGKYELVLPAGEEYMLVVEGGSYLPHAENFTVPSGKTIPGMHQKVVMNKTSNTEVLTMSNYFTPASVDSLTASLEKPTEVKKSEFDVKDTATAKMQTITFEGRTLFVAAPSIQSPQMKTVDVDGLAVANETQDETPKAVTNTETNTQEPTSPSTEDGSKTAENTDTENIKEAPVAPIAVNEKTSNAELVKMSLEDAQSVKEEANVLREEAAEKRVEAQSLDSLSKSQLRQANLLLSAGDQELSQQVFKQSQENVIASQVKNNEAKKLDADAHQKDLEYETSYQEAVQLMKEFKVDTNSSSYQAIVAKDKESESREARNEEATAAIDNNVHAIRSKQLESEADSLLNESKYVEEQATASKDKKEKAFLSEKAKELNEQAESRMAESKLEADIAEKETGQSLSTASAGETKNADPVLANDETVKANANEASPEKNITSESAEKTAANESTPSSQKDNPVVKNEEASPVVTNDNPAKATPSTAVAGTAVVPAKTQGAPVERKPYQKLAPVANVDPAAQEHFENYKQQLDESKYLEAASKETEAKLMNVNSTETRDSLENKTVELNKESIRMWQSASSELAIAKQIDPEVEKKMTAAAQTSAVQNDQVAANQKTTENNPAKEERNATTESTPSTGSDIQPEPSVNASPAENKNQPGNIETTEPASSTGSDIKPSLSVNASPTESKKQPGNTASTSTPAENNSASEIAGQPKASVEILDTTSPAYPEYVATQKEIVTKQTETVDIFVEGMQLSKKASAIKKEEMALRDQAVVTTDKKEKQRLEVRADSLAMEADLLSEKSKAMLSVAQKNTGEVKTLTAKSDKLKSELIVSKPTDEQSQPAASVAPSGNKIGEQQSSAEQSQNTFPESGTTSADGAVTESSSSPSGQEKSETQSVSNDAPVQQDKAGVAVAVSPSTSGNSDNKTQTETQDIPSQQEKSVQQDETVAENKSGERKADSEADNEVENKSSAPAIDVDGVPSSGSETISGTTASENKATDEKKVAGEEIISGEQETSNKKIYPEQEEGTAAALNESTSSDRTADAPQTKVEREMNVPGTTGSLVFEEEPTDATTFSLSKSNTYSEANTIPMDPTLPEGLVFKVQIGAFRKPLPDDAFNNLQPLSGETTRPGWIRYCLGLFRTFEPANLLKKEVRSMGYKDAFVVAYYNGKRIPLYDAYAIISKANAADKQTYSNVSSNEFKQLEKFEIKKSSFDLKPDADTKAFYGTTEIVSADRVEYAVQVGVYKTSRTPSALSSLVPLNTEQMSSGLFRFTTGRFDQRASADSMKRIAVSSGVKDAFVVIYRGGKKAGPKEAQQILNAARKETPAPSANQSAKASPSAAPASNETINASDIIFKIQLGAFKENVPFNTVTSFLAVADKGISQETDARGLHIFYAGQYTDYNEALAARSDIASKGVKDAFIVAFVKGKRTSATEALKLLNRN